METNKLEAKIRTELGKGPARRLKVKEYIPAVLYAKGQKTLPLIVCPKEISKILLGPFRRNSLINLELADQNNKKLGQKTVMVKERQIHPVSRKLSHIDFVEVDASKPVETLIPLLLHGKSEAVVQGGKLEHVLLKMRVSSLASDIPEKISVDISNSSFGSTHAADISLPKGVKLVEKPKVVVYTIKKPRGSKEEEEKAQAAAAPAAQAAPAKAPAAPKK